MRHLQLKMQEVVLQLGGRHIRVIVRGIHEIGTIDYSDKHGFLLFRSGTTAGSRKGALFAGNYNHPIVKILKRRRGAVASIRFPEGPDTAEA